MNKSLILIFLVVLLAGCNIDYQEHKEKYIRLYRDRQFYTEYVPNLGYVYHSDVNCSKIEHGSAPNVYSHSGVYCPKCMNEKLIIVCKDRQSKSR